MLKAIHHVVDLESSTVLDSTWESLFWGLAGFLKIPCKRLGEDDKTPFRRPDGSGDRYSPDFIVEGTAVEVKGLEDEDDRQRYAAWRSQVGPLAVIDRDALDALRKLDTAEEVLQYLREFSAPPAAV